MKKNSLVLIMAVLFLATGNVLYAQSPGLKIGDRAPSVKLKDFNDRVFALPECLKGKVAVIHFWSATCCTVGGKIPALASLERFHKEFREKGLVIVSVNVAQVPYTVLRFTNKITYLTLYDTDLIMAEAYGCLTKISLNLPQTFILDCNGIIKHKIIGDIPEKILWKLIKADLSTFRDLEKQSLYQFSKFENHQFMNYLSFYHFGSLRQRNRQLKIRS
jgi:peroxiredoxin